MYLSVERLERAGACQDEVAHFRRVFGSGRVRVTVERCVKHADDFDWLWAVRHLVPGTQLALIHAFYRLTLDDRRRYYRSAGADVLPTFDALRRAEARAFAHLVRYPHLRQHTTSRRSDDRLPLRRTTRGAKERPGGDV